MPTCLNAFYVLEIFTQFYYTNAFAKESMAEFDKEVLRIMKNIQALRISPKDKRLLNVS